MKKLTVILILLFLAFSCGDKKKEITYVKAPFKNLDTLATNDWWNRAKNPIINLKVERDAVIAFGIYTVSNNVLKLSAQLFPLYPEETREIRLELKNNNSWEEVQTQNVNELGWSCLFRIENWNSSKDTYYRLKHGKNAIYEGMIRKDPKEKKEISMAALSCNSSKDRGGRENIVKNINYQNPDIVFFAGDQSYDHKEHTAAWIKFGMQFREVFRNRPCITIPDDHDVGHGNFWGEGGKKASDKKGTDGGYIWHDGYVKMVERCQTAHLPDPFNPTPVQQGIGVYYTNIIVGEIDFAIIEDRKFKSGPKGKIPKMGSRPDHITDPNYNPSDIDFEGLTLLGERQLEFLNQWAEVQEGLKMKAVLSQTGFSGGAHLHGRKKSRLHADLDSNGWPQTGRNKALRAIKKANAVHIAGDQHLATVMQHGIDEFDDGPWAFLSPAIVNNFYSRWWWPKNEKPGKNNNKRLLWTGQYLDGFNNKITMHSYANPDNRSNGGGYGFIRFNKVDNKVTFECWPRDADVSKGDSEQFPGWPIAVNP